jgi:hypothetical protein
MDDHQTSEDDDADSEADAKRKAVEVAAIVATAVHTFEFGRSTVMKDRIRELEKLNYFAEGDERAPREEIVSKPERDEVVVFKDYFIVTLCKPPHLALAKILMKFKIQLHGLTPNTIVQLSKVFWAVATCGGKKTAEVFGKNYELH